MGVRFRVSVHARVGLTILLCGSWLASSAAQRSSAQARPGSQAHVATTDTDSDVCTLIGCADSVSANLQIAPDFEPGAYVLTFEIADERISCPLRLPVEPDASIDIACQGRRAHDAIRLVNHARHGLMAYAQFTATLTPQKVQVTLEHDHRRVAAATGRFSYHEFEPNGHECGLICRQGNASLTLAPAKNRHR